MIFKFIMIFVFVFSFGAMFGKWITETYHITHKNFKKNKCSKMDFIQKRLSASPSGHSEAWEQLKKDIECIDEFMEEECWGVKEVETWERLRDYLRRWLLDEVN